MYAQTVEIPADHRIVIDAPREIPAGKTVQVLFRLEGEADAAVTPAPKAPRKSGADIAALLNWREPTIEEMLAEAHKKGEERRKCKVDPLEKFCGSKIFGDGTDGLTYQHKMRAEWDREWDNE